MNNLEIICELSKTSIFNSEQVKSLFKNLDVNLKSSKKITSQELRSIISNKVLFSDVTANYKYLLSNGY